MKNPHNNSTLDIRHLELVRLRIGYLNNCNYSISLHFNELKNFGESDLRLSLVPVWKEVPHFSKKERALFALTEYIISDHSNQKHQSMYRLLEPHFSRIQIENLTQAIEQIDLWTRSMKHIDEFTDLS
jgi:AhpD family alkylhydroperoxidase